MSNWGILTLMPRSVSRVLPLDSRQDVFARRRVSVFLLYMADQRIRELVSVVAREGLLATRAAQCEASHAYQSRPATKIGR